MASLTETINRGVELLQQGNYDAAAALYRGALERSPEHPDALHLLSVATFQQGGVQEAVDLASRAIAVAGGKPDYYSNLGRYQMALGNLSQAVDMLRQALAIAPAHAMARLNLATALLAQGKKQEALVEVSRHLEAAPNDVNANHLKGTLLSELFRHAEAVECFEHVLALQPGVPEAHNNLGNVFQNLGRAADAVLQYEQALRLRPEYADAANNLGAALQALGHKKDAEIWFEQALRMRPGFPQARANLANLRAAEGRHEEAVAIYMEVLAATPESAESWNNLGNSLQELGRFDEALHVYGRALECNPAYYLVHNNIGNVLRRSGRPAEARAAFERALAHNANFPEALNNLGVTLTDLGLPVEAQACYERAIAVQSAYADPWINLGNLWRDSGQPERAAGCYRKAAELNPQNAFVWNNLGCAVGDQGSIAESIQCYQRAVTLMPSNHPAFSNILLNLHYVDGPSPEEIAAAHRQFGERFDGLGAHLRAPHTNPPDAERKLRIGYVSADFRRHSVAFFLEPVIERHDPDAVEVYCYSDVGRPDAMTERFTRLAGDRWRDIRGYSLERFAAQVRADGIDILIDTGGHTANSRLASFTTRAAPVQINWLGYPDTTGLPSIGYRFTDAVADPPGQTEAWHSEELIRLPGGFLSFRPPAGSPAPSAVPCLGGGPFTFGSFNNLSKISQATVALWGEILRRTPGSRLALKNRSLNESQARTNLLTSFAAHGIAAERIWLSGLIDSLKGHLEAYGLIDLALDTFPYHGTTTTCEALWMGVPVVTLAGRTHASRVGVSLLGAVGLSELVAASEQDYIDRACSVATDVGRLKAWRASLRETMTASALMDEAGFTRKLEAAYRDLWRRWCKKQERT